jgi:hypothetical protein
MNGFAVFTGIADYSRIPIHDLIQNNLASTHTSLLATDVYTFPVPGMPNSSTNVQTENVRLSRVWLKLSLIRSRVGESCSRSRIRLSFVFRRTTCATEATTLASEAMLLPLCGVPRKIIPRVAEKMWARRGWLFRTRSERSSAYEGNQLGREYE